MFETQVEKYTLLPRALANADGYGDPWNDLKSALEIVGPPNTRADVTRIRPFGLIGSRNLLHAVESTFQHYIEARTHQPDRAGA